ncbi:uncharacterized protein LOC126790438 isoform X2 [Argentina anserina]|uniref:uncharacterized protein LOC126790438 isoform X2 n=1 Tax=Argentina anserina TaxID=57926 RepID=UPI0021768AE5|nr:uncharacterized protein LOC126790438 isoform X2 [Potentilla anserina]
MQSSFFGMAAKFHCTTPLVVYKQRPALLRSPGNFIFKCFNRNPVHSLVIQVTSTVSTRWDFLKCNNISWRWVSQIVSLYLFFLNIVAGAQAYDYSAPVYACEDVNSYYANVGNLVGKSLKRKLNSIIGKHQSLSYREVWNALKILDASDVDNPEASSGIVEIYSLKVVPKSLAGKPEGWNREHLWPRSYGLKNGPSLTDIHNIRPADVNVNSSRGNKYYGECIVTSAKCLKPANKEAALDTETDKSRWAPPKQRRYCKGTDVHGSMLWVSPTRWRSSSSPLRFSKNFKE